MVAVKIVLRLMRNIFLQWPLKFCVPKVNDDLTGQIAVVTGGNAGIGLETVRFLARTGMTVVVGCRNTSKGNKAIQQLAQEESMVSTAVACSDRADWKLGVVSPAGGSAGSTLDVHMMELDLADLLSVSYFAKRVQHLLGGQQLQLLVLNAGISGGDHALSKQGHELQFATNHLGHFHLTQLLLTDVLSPGGRIVFVNGDLHILAEDATPDFEYSGKHDPSAYCRSKLASIWHAYELQRRRPDLVVPVLHPGVVNTELADVPVWARWIKNLFFISPIRGAVTTLYCCLAPNVKGLTYYHNSLGVYPSSVASYDTEKAAAMWELSTRLTKEFT